MMTVINAADDQYEIEKIDLTGPTFAIVNEDEVIFNHQTTFTDKLLKPNLTLKEEAKSVGEFLAGKDVTICFNVNGMFKDYVETWEEISELDDDDWYLEGTVVEVKEGQLQVETDEDELEWIPFKHIDTIELGTSDEAYEFEETEEE